MRDATHTGQGQGLTGRVLKGEPYSEDKLAALENAILEWREQMAVKYPDLDMSEDVPSAYSRRVPDLIATIRALQADMRARDDLLRMLGASSAHQIGSAIINSAALPGQATGEGGR